MLKLAAQITDIEGKSGGVIYRKDQCGPHMQAAPRKVKQEPTPDQEARLRAFRICTGYMRENATEHFVYCWSHYAIFHPKVTKKGKIIPLTWWQIFISYNINRVIAGEPIAQLPPGYPPGPPA